MAKRKTGQRYKSGRLKGPTTRAARKSQAPDYGNDAVQKRRALFDCRKIKNGNKAVLDQVHDGIGQLWALDYLDGHGFEDSALRDAGRTFAELWWDRYQATAPAMQKYERASRTTNFYEGRTTRDRIFDRMDDSLTPGSIERSAVVTLCVDYWFRDYAAPWAHRLVCLELLKRGRTAELMELPGPDQEAQDREMLAGLVRGLCLLIDAGLPARWERRVAA
jgi:hypothetical protein